MNFFEFFRVCGWWWYFSHFFWLVEIGKQRSLCFDTICIYQLSINSFLNVCRLYSPNIFWNPAFWNGSVVFSPKNLSARVHYGCFFSFSRLYWFLERTSIEHLSGFKLELKTDPKNWGILPKSTPNGHPYVYHGIYVGCWLHILNS